MTQQSTATRRVGLVIPILFALAILIPSLYLLLTSFRRSPDFLRNPLGLPSELTFDNYVTAWGSGQVSASFAVTAFVTVVSTVGVVFLASLAAYGLSRWTNKWSTGLYLFFIAGLIVPFQLGLPTLYRVWVTLGISDTLLGAVLVHVGAGLPLAIFLYVGFLRNVPHDIEEAARIDGASEFRVYWSIVFPLLRPITATVVILSCIYVWNDLLISLYFLQDPNLYTLPRLNLVLTNSLQTDTPALLASAVISVVPVLLVFVGLQRSFMAGLTSGAVRG